MLKEKAGNVAGQIWTALNGTDGLTHKQIKKATKLIDKDFFLGLGWLLREDKVSTSEVEGEIVHTCSTITSTVFVIQNRFTATTLERLILICNS